MKPPWLVVSPHCDDGVFSCGALLAAHPGSAVVTVFAGRPARYEPFTEWDRTCGFRPGDDVMASRRREDAAALACLAAQPLWLPFLDSQYRSTPRVDEVAAALSQAIDRCAPRAIAFPLGLFHSDHVLVREAMLALASRRELPPAAVYVDALYRCIPGAVETALGVLSRRGYALRERKLPSDAAAAAAKREAVECYASQLRGLATPGRPGHLDAYSPERRLDFALAVAPA